MAQNAYTAIIIQSVCLQRMLGDFVHVENCKHMYFKKKYCLFKKMSVINAINYFILKVNCRT